MPGAKISTAHGTVRPVDPATGAPSAVAFAMYHPAAAFRQTALKETLVADMANLPQVLLDARRGRSLRTERAGVDGEQVASRQPADARQAADAPADAPADARQAAGLAVDDARADTRSGADLAVEPDLAADPAAPDDQPQLAPATEDAPDDMDRTDQMTLF